MDILTRIVARKKEEIEEARRREPLERLRETATHLMITALFMTR